MGLREDPSPLNRSSRFDRGPAWFAKRRRGDNARESSARNRLWRAEAPAKVSVRRTDRRVSNAARWSAPDGRTWRRDADPPRRRGVDGRMARRCDGGKAQHPIII